MSEKNRDEHGRWRNRTIGFRVSPEEDAEINALVALSGLTKQDYIINRLCSASDISPEALRVLEAMTRIYDGMKAGG